MKERTPMEVVKLIWFIIERLAMIAVVLFVVAYVFDFPIIQKRNIDINKIIHRLDKLEKVIPGGDK